MSSQTASAQNRNERSLTKWIGSKEEMILKTRCKFMENLKFKETYVNLVIEVCNAMAPVSFSQSCIVVENFNLEMQRKADDEIYPYHMNVFFGDVFKTGITEMVAKDGLASVPEERDSVFVVLLEYLHNLKDHQTSLSSVKVAGINETVLNAVLAQHLFSQLIPGHQYKIDNRQSKQPRKCPCSCGADILYGSTALGSSSTWHGFTDMILNQNISVSLLSKDYQEVDDKNAAAASSENDNTEPTAIDSSTECDETESPAKKMCTEKRIGIELCVEVKTDNASKQIFNNIKTQSQILAETITNAFVQVRRNEELSGWLIPTFGATSGHVAAFLYDPKNDILLENLYVLPIWEDDGKSLCVLSIIEIWMLLNFTTFTYPNLADRFILRKSEFHTQKCLARYWEIGDQSPISSFETELYIDNAMQNIRRFGKHPPIRSQTTKKDD